MNDCSDPYTPKPEKIKKFWSFVKSLKKTRLGLQHLEAIYTGDVSPKIVYTHYRVENPGKCWLTLHIAIKEMDKRVYQTFVFLVLT